MQLAWDDGQLFDDWLKAIKVSNDMYSHAELCQSDLVSGTAKGGNMCLPNFECIQYIIISQ